MKELNALQTKSGSAVEMMLKISLTSEESELPPNWPVLKVPQRSPGF